MSTTPAKYFLQSRCHKKISFCRYFRLITLSFILNGEGTYWRDMMLHWSSWMHPVTLLSQIWIHKEVSTLGERRSRHWDGDVIRVEASHVFCKLPITFLLLPATLVTKRGTGMARSRNPWYVPGPELKIPPKVALCIKNYTFVIKSALIGDSGGPLLKLDLLDDNYTLGDPSSDLLVGITSFGYDWNDIPAPGVYTRIAFFRDWIDCIIDNTVCVSFLYLWHHICHLSLLCICIARHVVRVIEGGPPIAQMPQTSHRMQNALPFQFHPKVLFPLLHQTLLKTETQDPTFSILFARIFLQTATPRRPIHWKWACENECREAQFLAVLENPSSHRGRWFYYCRGDSLCRARS